MFLQMNNIYLRDRSKYSNRLRTLFGDFLDIRFECFNIFDKIDLFLLKDKYIKLILQPQRQKQTWILNRQSK